MCSVATPNSLYAITLPRPSGADRYAYVKDMCIVWPWITSAVQCSAPNSASVCREWKVEEASSFVYIVGTESYQCCVFII